MYTPNSCYKNLIIDEPLNVIGVHNNEYLDYFL